MKLMTKLKIGGVFIVAVLICALISAFYFGVYTKRPQYTLKMVGEAVEHHDTSTFYKYVDVDNLLEESYNDLIEGFLSAEHPIGEEEREMLGSFTHILKAPLIESLKTALNNYVSTGEWTAKSDGAQGTPIDTEEVLTKSGLSAISFRQIDDVETMESGDAVAKIRCFQQDLQDEFVFDVLLTKDSEGVWRVREVANFSDFIQFVGNMRREKLAAYRNATASIISRHNKKMADTDLRITQMVGLSGLSANSTREEIKKLMEDVVIRDWQERKQELSEVEVPASAEALHKLRLKICDLYIAYAEGYAQWMTDKKAATIREAEGKLRQAKTLEQEEAFLTQRMISYSEGY